MPGDEQEPSPHVSPWRAFMRRLAPWLKAIAITLFALAIWRAWVGVHWADVFKQSPRWLLFITGAILLNFALSDLLILLITRTFKPQPGITYPAMARLLLASSLLNYGGYFVPVGLVFRAGYLKTAHNIPLTASAKTAGLMLAMTALVSLGLILSLTVPLCLLLALIAWGVGSALLGRVWARFAPDPRSGAPWAWLTIRLAELLTQALRVWISFHAVGADISPPQAVVVAAVTVLAGMASGMPSGLGVREWAMSLSGAWLNIAKGPVGLAAALVDRACEVLVYLALGGPSLIAFKRHPTDPQPPRP